MSQLVALGALAFVSVLGACSGDSTTGLPPDDEPDTGSLALSITGLPGGTPASVTVAGPGFSMTVTATGTLRDLAPGSYTITAANVETAGQTYAPEPASQQVSVAAGTSAANAAVAYAPTTASLTVSISGVPAGANGAVTVTGPGSFSRTLTATTTMSGLQPGAYTVVAAAVAHEGRSYVGAPASQEVSLVAGTTREAAVGYAVETHSFELVVKGVPDGASALVTVHGPDGYSRAVGATTTLTGLVAGSYTVTAESITAIGHSFAPIEASQVVEVASGTNPGATVEYELRTGAIAVQVSGLPGLLDAEVTVTGPGGFTQRVAGTRTLTNLAPGAYTVSAATVTSGSKTYAPSPASRSVEVTASLVAQPAVVTYAEQVTTGSIRLSVDGLPEGKSANYRLRNSAGTIVRDDDVVQGATVDVTGLQPGTYTLVWAEMAVGTYGQQRTYAPTPASTSLTVTASLTPVDGAVTYALATGEIALSVDGLPDDEQAYYTIRNSAGTTEDWGYVRQGATVPVTNLKPGSYTVTWRDWDSQHVPSPKTTNVTVTATLTPVPVTVTYSTP